MNRFLGLGTAFGFIGVIATSTGAENLHRKYGPSWDCGYITAGLPYYADCKRCEDRGMEFDQVGDHGRCVPKSGNDGDGTRDRVRKKLERSLSLPDNGAPLRDRLRERLDSPPTTDGELIRPQEIPTPTTPRKSQITSRHWAGTIDPRLKDDLANVYSKTKVAIAALKVGDWSKALDLIDDDDKARALSSGSRPLKRHLQFSIQIARLMRWQELGRLTVQKMQAIEGNTLAAAKRAAKAFWGIALKDETLLGQSFASLTSELKDESPQMSEIVDQFDAVKAKATKAAQVSNMTREMNLNEGDKKTAYMERCRELGGVVKDDFPTVYNNQKGWLCDVRPFSEEEVHQLVREYEDYLKG